VSLSDPVSDLSESIPRWEVHGEALLLRFLRLTVGCLLALAAVLPLPIAAQDDPSEAPLGDVARNLRKKAAPAQDVIDNDNFSDVMTQAESKHAAGSSLKFLFAGEGKGFQVSAPDVTCSLSFSANTKALLSGQYAQMDMPAQDVLKLKGHATIEGDALTIPVANGTGWHVSEVAVALTVVRKNAGVDESAGIGISNAIGSDALAGSEVRPEKKPDQTVIYRMRAAAPPFTTTVFSAPLNQELGTGDEWHWAIVQAKGYPPRTYSENDQTAAQKAPAAAPNAEPSGVPTPSLLPASSSTAALSSNQ
jgi:hypothetical protein